MNYLNPHTHNLDGDTATTEPRRATDREIELARAWISANTPVQPEGWDPAYDDEYAPALEIIIFANGGRYAPPQDSKTIAKMTSEVRALNVEKGWRTGGNTFGDYIALLHSELSEALEAYRDRRLKPYTTDAGKPDDVGSEFADVLIRLLDAADVYGIDLAAEYERKIAYNRTRPYQHGGRTLSDVGRVAVSG